MVDDICDETLIKRSLDGSTEAFDALVRRYQGRLFSFLLQRLFDAQDAEDITQETFLRCWQRLHQYRSRYRFSTWLFTIGHRLAINHLRRGGSGGAKPHIQDSTVMASEHADHSPGAAPPLARSIAAEARARLWEAAAEALSPAELETMWLRYAEDLTAREIGHITGRSSVGVRVMLHRARQRLQEYLAEHDDSDDFRPTPAEAVETAPPSSPSGHTMDVSWAEEPACR